MGVHRRMYLPFPFALSAVCNLLRMGFERATTRFFNGRLVEDQRSCIMDHGARLACSGSCGESLR